MKENVCSDQVGQSRQVSLLPSQQMIQPMSHLALTGSSLINVPGTPLIPTLCTINIL